MRVLLCIVVFVYVSNLKFSGLVLMSSGLGGPLKQDTQETDIVIVYVD